MKAKAGSHFLRTSTGIQSRPKAFDKSRLAMTFLINLGVTWILCSFILVLEGNAAKVIPELSRFELLEIFFANNFALSEANYKTSSLLIEEI